ncbi:hypothetical protein B0A55_11006 [Friedmanniomyces simplex]|uniref:Uncharacterized protein n=1 Tax=Friedmanniomyces simplex TaxID=329884 RepID=A0A4U0WGB9_9PEZI|nr:hypothetical protein B0A55_11006 [Friedmanniomyces simplex]
MPPILGLALPRLGHQIYTILYKQRKERAFALITINAYNLLGALQDSWAVYWFSFFSRVVAAGLFAVLSGGWAGMVPLELGSAFLLVATMAFAPGGKVKAD